MPEIITLTTPVPAVTNYRVAELHLCYSAAFIRVVLQAPAGEMTSHEYSGSVATALLNQLNVANLSTTSLHKRVIQRLVSDGKIAGTISGSPD